MNMENHCRTERTSFVKEVQFNSTNKAKFRAVARDATGDTFDVPDGNKIAFLYDTIHGEELLLGVACYDVGISSSVLKDSSPQMTEYQHSLTYLFIKPRYQKRGYGQALYKFVENKMRQEMRKILTKKDSSKALLKQLKKTTRQIVKVQAAEKAVPFFEKMGYVAHGEPIKPICPGSSLFRRLHDMDKVL